MTALSDALTAAQRSALAALEKAYVAEKIDAEAMSEAMESCGITDAVDRAFLIASLDILKEWGVSAPNLTERLARENGMGINWMTGAELVEAIPPAYTALIAPQIPVREASLAA